MTTLDVVTTAHTHPEHVPGDADPWLTATIRPAGSFGRADAGRLRALLDALSACASIVVLDLRSARLRSRGAAAVVEDAAAACCACTPTRSPGRTSPRRGSAW
jgi:hypothetical protein